MMATILILTLPNQDLTQSNESYVDSDSNSAISPSNIIGDINHQNNNNIQQGTTLEDGSTDRSDDGSHIEIVIDEADIPVGHGNTIHE